MSLISIEASAVLDRDAPQSGDREAAAATWTGVGTVVTALFATAAVLLVSFLAVVMNLD